jgi:hypothetical protein
MRPHSQRDGKRETEKGTSLIIDRASRLAVMPRTTRAVEAGLIYHVLNRGNRRLRPVRKDNGFAAFEKTPHPRFGALFRRSADLLPD